MGITNVKTVAKKKENRFYYKQIVDATLLDTHTSLTLPMITGVF